MQEGIQLGFPWLKLRSLPHTCSILKSKARVYLFIFPAGFSGTIKMIQVEKFSGHFLLFLFEVSCYFQYLRNILYSSHNLAIWCWWEIHVHMIVSSRWKCTSAKDFLQSTTNLKKYMIKWEHLVKCFLPFLKQYSFMWTTLNKSRGGTWVSKILIDD